VRNDLSRIAKPGTVKVEELFGIHSYPTVTQMISTISAETDVGFSDIIKSTFPMGSMTGAPKIKAMELIDQYENFNRGLYSGTIGYFKNDGFDFNVVIRSLQYANNKLGLHVGSAITFESSPEEEYKECLLKAKSLLELFSSK
jgi:para-aminobenzoate synthetase component 1